jgi:hypothetical protein
MLKQARQRVAAKGWSNAVFSTFALSLEPASMK